MKKTWLALAVLFTMAVGLPGTVMGKSAPALGPPQNLTCDFTASAPPTIYWDDLGSATKYSVEVIAGYDTSLVPDGLVDVTVTYSFTTTLSELDLLFSTLGLFIDPDTFYPIEVDVKVKGLRPPGKSQNNPFTSASCTLPTSG